MMNIVFSYVLINRVVNAPKDAIIIVSDYRLVVESDITSLVECAGIQLLALTLL